MASHDIFISYKSDELEAAKTVKEALEKCGISCWMAPMSMAGGSNYAKEIPEAIQECKAFILILSEKAQQSAWIPRELDQAINKNKVVLPFMIENCTLTPSFEFYLSNVQRYTAYENKAEAIDMLLEDVIEIVKKSGKEIQRPEAEPTQKPKMKPKPEPTPHSNAQISVADKFANFVERKIYLHVILAIYALGTIVIPCMAIDSRNEMYMPPIAWFGMALVIWTLYLMFTSRKYPAIVDIILSIAIYVFPIIVTFNVPWYWVQMFWEFAILGIFLIAILFGIFGYIKLKKNGQINNIIFVLALLLQFVPILNVIFNVIMLLLILNKKPEM